MSSRHIMKPPMEQPFYRKLASVATLLGLADQTWWGLEPCPKLFFVNRFLVLLLSPLSVVSQVVYMYVHFDELTFNTLGIMFSIIPVTILVFSIMISSKQKCYENVMKGFMEQIHLSNYADQNEFVRKMLQRVEQYTRWTSYYLFAFLMTDCVAWIFFTGLNNVNNMDAIRNKTERLQTVVYFYLPFDYEYDIYNWICVHCFNTYVAWCGCIIIVVFNTINYAFIYNLIGHLHVLKHKIKTQFSGDYKEDEVRTKLIDIVEYHSFVTKIFKDIEDAFGINVAANYLYNFIADSLLLYQIMFGDKGNLMMYGLMVVVYVGGLILLSFVLEEIRRQSDGLSDLVYNLPWEKMTVSNQKMVVLILARMQPALVFKTTGGLRAGVRPMISILKSTFSYYVMLKSRVTT